MEETRRERKKRQTRELLVNTAFRLFKEQGYEQTTVVQISAEADVAVKTFSNYFPSKEDVVFADIERSYEMALEVVEGRAPGERVPDLLVKTYERVFYRYMTDGPPVGDRELEDMYAQLIATVPAVQAKALHVMFNLQRKIADAFVKAFPDELDPIIASAAVGALMGAVQATGLASHRLGQSEEESVASLRHAIDLVMRGLSSL
ncbi:TetR/AcrR family transcriptional regulator [Nonomuraea angiospora]|uniref:AcrR family transcriptional regulator n=1 Tax=Nonomuraea angiospora TaxID=46172 RepID=A0ABR9M2Z7_9ACTN|nr:TetR/AcrR family transcriptional regulator [Nonomuraea angiospora]MBE1586980.1 AcrR family transcriptional regulator [Nonomuraea angiospora]